MKHVINQASKSGENSSARSEDFRSLFNECQCARDEVGFIGSVPDCIRYLAAEVERLERNHR